MPPTATEEKNVTLKGDSEELDRKLRAEARKEWTSKREGKVKSSDEVPEDKPSETVEKPAEVAKPEEKPEDKPIEKEVPKEDKETKEAEPQPVKEEPQPAEKQPEASLPKPEDKQEAKVYDDEFIRQYALKENLTVKEAKEELEGIEGIVAKYKGDPKELAKAYRRIQSSYDVEKAKSVNAERGQLVSNPRPYIKQKVQENKVKLCEEYRKTYPAKSRDMEDEQILEELEDRYIGQYESMVEKYQAKMKVDASTKRDTLINSVPEIAKRYLPDIKKILSKVPDSQIVSDNFDLNDIVYWVTGQYTSELIKEAEERGRKSASEQKRILGQVPSAPTESKAKVATVKKSSLSSSEQKRALQMFEGTTMTEDEMYEEYANLKKKK